MPSGFGFSRSRKPEEELTEVNRFTFEGKTFVTYLVSTPNAKRKEPEKQGRFAKCSITGNWKIKVDGDVKPGDKVSVYNKSKNVTKNVVILSVDTLGLCDFREEEDKSPSYRSSHRDEAFEEIFTGDVPNCQLYGPSLVDCVVPGDATFTGMYHREMQRELSQEPFEDPYELEDLNYYTDDCPF